MATKSTSLKKAVEILDLMEELLIIIFSKLSVTSLLRLKSVCKSWYTLITSPSFVTMHLNSKDRRKDYLGFITYGSNSIYVSFFSYHTMEFSSNLRQHLNAKFVGFSKGLLCVVTKNEKSFYAINPATKEYKLLKEPNKHLAGHTHGLVSACYGFAFDSEANDYKLVRVTIQKTEVLTLKSNSWRCILMNDHSTSVMKGVWNLVDPWSKAVTKHALHWIVMDQKIKKFIIAFDIVNEEFRDIEIPGDIDQDYCSYHCSVLEDCLSVSILNTRPSVIENKIEVWMMKEYGVERSWIKQYSFSVQSHDRNECIFYYMLRGIKGEWDSDEIFPLAEPMRLDFDEFFDIYQLPSHDTDKFFDLYKLFSHYGGFMFCFRESLIPIDRKEEDQFLLG
ncbi:F-box domain containing protein [Parasponia andersonii]|uniref:F-box domain containing protein n=1 Tax=Parasponia andersonii TaxID=3476 RepID=A0A2P5AB74_PARAD|nr:F-box domain containing protein [Parasponia andersonii]